MSPSERPEAPLVLAVGVGAAAVAGVFLGIAALVDINPDNFRDDFTAGQWLGLAALVPVLLVPLTFRGAAANVPAVERAALAHFLGPVVLFLFTLSLAVYLPFWVRLLLWSLSLLGCGVVLHTLDEGRFPVGSVIGGLVGAAFLAAKVLEPAPASKFDLAWLCVVVALAPVLLTVAPLCFAWSLFRQRARFGPVTDLVTATLLGAAAAQFVALLWLASRGQEIRDTADKDAAVIDLILKELRPTAWRVVAGLEGIVCAVVAQWGGFILWRYRTAAPIIAPRTHELVRTPP